MSSPIAFVTGGTGFIGSHLVERLIAHGYSVRCLIRNPNRPGYLEGLPVEFYVGDLFASNVLERAISQVDYVFHVAGVVGSRTKEGFYTQNRDATRSLAGIASRVSVGLRRFVFVSSLAAVGPATAETAVDESTPYHPITTYGKSKMEAELEVLKVRDRVPITIVRPAAVYGPRDPATFDYFNTINRGLEPLVGFRDKFVNLVHSADVVTGILLAAESDRSVGQSYFLGSEVPLSWSRIGEITKKVMGKRTLRVRIPESAVYAIATFAGLLSLFQEKPSVLNFEKGRDMVQDYWTCSIAKAQRELGYQPAVSLEDGIRETVEWYRINDWMSA